MIYHPSVNRIIQYLPAIIARYYGCSFFLVGSAQHDSNPRDIDIIGRIPDDLFLAMYGSSGETIDTWAHAVDDWEFSSDIWKMWARDISKQGKEMTMIAGRQVDFKTQPLSYFNSISKNRTYLPSMW